MQPQLLCPFPLARALEAARYLLCPGKHVLGEQVSLVPAYLRYELIFQELRPPPPQASQTPSFPGKSPRGISHSPQGQARPGHLDSQEGMTEQLLGEGGEVSDHLPEEQSLCFPRGPHVSHEEAQRTLVPCPAPDPHSRDCGIGAGVAVSLRCCGRGTSV